MLLQRTGDKLVHYRLIGECVWELLRARRAILRRPFEETARTLSLPLSAMQTSAEPERIVRQVRRALGSIRRRTPWKFTCLVRAIAAHRVLARRMIASNLVLSVTPASGKTVDAHAWLEVGDVVVTGSNEKEKYVPIYTFSNAGSQDERNALAERTRPCSL
jgi:hypothetical protein